MELEEQVSNQKNLITFLWAVIWAVVIGFATLCITGFFNLSQKIASAEDKTQEVKNIAIVGDTAVRLELTQRIEKLDDKMERYFAEQRNVNQNMLGKLDEIRRHQ